jgi:hypothetical protein
MGDNQLNDFKFGKYEAKWLIIFVIFLAFKFNSNDLNDTDNIL